MNGFLASWFLEIFITKYWKWLYQVLIEGAPGAITTDVMYLPCKLKKTEDKIEHDDIDGINFWQKWWYVDQILTINTVKVGIVEWYVITPCIYIYMIGQILSITTVWMSRCLQVEYFSLPFGDMNSPSYNKFTENVDIFRLSPQTSGRLL